MNRENIAVAILAKLQGVAGFNTVSRRWRPVKDVAPVDQPAAFLTSAGESVTCAPGMPATSEIDYDITLYAHVKGDPAIPPSTILNPLTDAIIAAFKPDNPILNKVTLGGLVEHCWVEGNIETDEGLFGDQGVVIIPLRVKVSN